MVTQSLNKHLQRPCSGLLARAAQRRALRSSQPKAQNSVTVVRTEVQGSAEKREVSSAVQGRGGFIEEVTHGLNLER